MTERDIFIAALQKEARGERQAFLDSACAGEPDLRKQVSDLLRLHDNAGRFLEDSEADNSSPCETAGNQIGPYKLIQQLGEGGMGTVWMAQQIEPVKRFVAVKLIKAGMDSKQVIARFEAERQALALMDHPNIARVLEAGATGDGRPYFVMDLVKGAPITAYCDEHHLTPRQRLELFIPVCQAVQHAHQKGVIHRDLKPSNVLVALYDGRPVPKVIDFGVAKAAGHPLTEQSILTGFGAIVGTLEYMSPEQAEMNQLDIDTRSDIYSLGVLLYELLVGSPPFSRQETETVGLLETLRVIREKEPLKPSLKLSTTEGLPALAANRSTEPAKLAKLVRGELDWIVMKALEKDRHRRYETADAFALDLQRYLASEPVLACLPSARYRVGKFARRHWRGLSAALAFVVLLSGAVITLSATLVMVNRERHEKEVALQAEAKRRQQARTALDAMESQVIEDWLAKQAALSPEQRQFLEQALHSYEEFAADTGQDEQSRAGVAHAHWRVGLIQERLGQRKEAEAAWLRSRDLYIRLAEDSPGNPAYRRQLAKVYTDLDDHYSYTGQPKETDIVSGQALAISRQLAAEFPDVTEYQLGLIEALNHRGRTLTLGGQTEDAEAIFNEALISLQKLPAEARAAPAYRSELAQVHMGFGAFLRATRRSGEAVAHYEQAVSIHQQLVAEFPGRRDHRDSLVRGLSNLGASLDELDRRPEAVLVMRQALPIQRQLVIDFPGVPFYRKGLAMNLSNLGLALSALGHTQEAEEQYRQALTLFEQLAAESQMMVDHRHGVAGTMVNLAGIELERKDFAAARRWLEDALPHHQAALKANPNHPAGAATAAGEFLDAAAEPSRDAYTAAVFFADCARLATQDERLAERERRELTTAYGARAVAALRLIVPKGAEDVAQLKEDPKLDPLRQREDFKTLLAEWDARRKTPEPTAKPKDQ
jgi:serine/threonine protein kinase/tetratricopeptide (TPR) repeat protein